MKKILITILCVLGFICSIANTQAATINLNFNNTNADYLVGTVTPGSPSDIEAETVYLNQLLSMGANSTATIDYGNPLGTHTFLRSDLSNSNLPVTSGLSANKTDTTSAPLINVNSSDYIVAKYGNQSAVWYVGDLANTDEVQLPTNFGQNGISNFTTWGTGGNNTSVPESSIIFLLGLGLIGLAGMRRKLQR